jgi:hypothetical protein
MADTDRMEARPGNAKVSRAGAVLLALLVGSTGAVAAFGPASAVPAPVARHAPAGVVSPRPGAVLSAHPPLIRLRLARRARGLKVTLNGRSIAAYFSPRRHGVRRLRVSPAHGLRYGRNVLRVSARRGRKRRRRTRVVRFRVKTDRPLASAGLDRAAAPGDRLKLDGTKSRLQPRARRRGAKLRFHWSIVRSPGRHRQAAQPPAALSNPNSPTPVVTPTAVGSATLQLTVTGPEGETGSDLVNVRADPAPSVRLETGAREGNNYGIALHGPIEKFYRGDPTKWLDLLVLKRGNLEFVSQKDYECKQATEHPSESEWEAVKPCIAQVQADLARLKAPGSPYLVIAANLPGAEPGAEPPVGVGGALGGYVGGWEWWPQDAKLQRGTYAAVFSPGAGVSHSTEHAAANPSEAGTGMIADDLGRDNEGNYSIVTGQRPWFDTQAPGSNASQNVIAVGEEKFVQPLPANSQGGFQVVLVDARTLVGESRWFETHSYGLAGLGGMYDMLKRANESSQAQFAPKTLVFVASRGDPSVQWNDNTYPWFDKLGGEIEGAEGTRSRFYTALIGKMSKQNSYTLVGEAGGIRGLGTEVLGPGPAPPPASINTAPLDGVVSRSGPTYQYRVETANPSPPEGEPNLSLGAAELLQVAGQPPTPWPEQGNLGRAAAIEYIGLKVFGTDTPRSQYWTIVYKPATWRELREAIEKLSFPSTEQKFSEADFTWAKGELIQEIKWLVTTNTYAETLAQPFNESRFSSWMALKAVAKRVEELVYPPNGQAGAQATAIWEFALNLGQNVPLAGNLIGAANAIYHFGMAEAKLNGEPTEARFGVKVSEIGEALENRLVATEKLLVNQLPDAIVSDYGRLKTTGACASAVAEDWSQCPFEHAVWQYTQDDAKNASRTLETSSRAAAYSAMLPVKYHAYELPIDEETEARRFAGVAVGCKWPFLHEPATGQYARPIFEDIGDQFEPRKETWIVTALGFLKGRGEVAKPWEMQVPAAQLTERIFGEGESNHEPNLHLDREEFFDRSYPSPPMTLPYYPWSSVSKTGWLSACVNPPGGRRLSAPRRTSVGRAAAKGIPVGFEVPSDGSTARLTLSLGAAKPKRAAKAKAPLRAGSVLASLRLESLEAGGHSVRIRIRRLLARPVRESRFQRATLWLTVSSPEAGSSTTKSSIALRR